MDGRTGTGGELVNKHCLELQKYEVVVESHNRLHSKG